MSGLFSVRRGITSHPTIASKPFCRGFAFIWLIENAAWEARDYDINGKIVRLQRGQLSATIRYLAAAWGWKRTRVERFLTRLKTETTIETATGTGQLIITLCNYDIHQLSKNLPETATETATGTEAGQKRDKTNKYNKVNKRESAQNDLFNAEKKPPKRRTQFPADWTPDPGLLKWCLEKGVGRSEALDLAESCVLHHRGKGNSFIQHDSAFRLWVKRELKYHPKKPAEASTSAGIMAELRREGTI